jgi:16S rRNA (cytosine1402-N4)-methyltransferase
MFDSLARLTHEYMHFHRAASSSRGPSFSLRSRRIARALVAGRPWTRTAALAEAVAKASGWQGSRTHPATKTFQALRIAVNDELGELERALPAAVSLLRPTGRLALISFHSLEDRIIKHEFQKLAGRRREKDLPKELAAIINQQNQDIKAEIIKPFPTLPSDLEVKENYRSRSAKLRILEKHV